MLNRRPPPDAMTRLFETTDALRFMLAMSLASAGLSAALAEAHSGSARLSPVALAATQDGRLFVACATAERVLCFDASSRKVTGSISVPAPPSGLALSPDDTRLYVTCAAPRSSICIVDTGTLKVIGSLSAGHTAMSSVVSPNGKTLYVCNRFDNNVSEFDLTSSTEETRMVGGREPVSTALARDGRLLLVADLLPEGRTDVPYVAAVVRALEVDTGEVVKEFHLPNGSTSLEAVSVSPDGKYAVVTHLIAQFNKTPIHLYARWMNGNALTVLDLARMQVLGTVLLDDRGRGAANPRGVAWSPDGKILLVTHAGTDEISLIDFPSLVKKMLTMPAPVDLGNRAIVASLPSEVISTANYIPFFPSIRWRISLPQGDLGPRSAVILGDTAYVANYFSDTLTVIDLREPSTRIASVALGPKPNMDLRRTGELYFHDARICFEGWQSCASCHPGDARSDGLNWDLLNDGTGNPKNTRSLLLAFETPPAMSLGVRPNAAAAVRAGIRHILFSHQPDGVADAIDAYLKSLKPVPSPYLVDGKLTDAARRGKRVFALAGCAGCHTPPLFTDLRPHDVGTQGAFDKPTDRFYTPGLVECWRTAPYLHDGSAATIGEVITLRNQHDRHGATSKLSASRIEDLVRYVLSL
jgi:DNA-binding beta-propeller fold protein YncE/mono/diheme cytochrome c family protein